MAPPFFLVSPNNCYDLRDRVVVLMFNFLTVLLVVSNSGFIFFVSILGACLNQLITYDQFIWFMSMIEHAGYVAAKFITL